MISLIPLEFSSSPDIERLRGELELKLGVSVRLFESPDFNAKDFFDAARNQYYSSAMLEYLERIKPSDASRIIGITNHDLFIPILTYVFGEAMLNGPCAVVSSFRLDNAQYGLPPNHALLMERVLKEALHEIGHTYGLVHCRDPFCVMRSSTYVEDIDYKGMDFCPSCREIIQEK